MSRMIQKVLPPCVVKVDEFQGEQMWYVELSKDKVIGIGSTFHEAKATVSCLITAVEARRKMGWPEEKILPWGKRGAAS
jgi:hypothetical protein